jgi:hypothetical protein
MKDNGDVQRKWILVMKHVIQKEASKWGVFNQAFFVSLVLFVYLLLLVLLIWRRDVYEN